MPEIYFSHSEVDALLGGPLKVETGANQFTWNYGLNTQVFPTYGGEVVQILSAYIEDITIQGEVGTYRKMEEIYKWFLTYMQIASQSSKLGQGFNQEPCVMKYPERGWVLSIQPKTLPGFRYGTEVTAPTWEIGAQVYQGDADMSTFTMRTLQVHGFDFGKLHAGIGYDQSNPFTDPAASGSQYDPKQMVSHVADFYNNLIDAYSNGDFNSLLQGFGSGPPNSQANTGNTGGSSSHHTVTGHISAQSKITQR